MSQRHGVAPHRIGIASIGIGAEKQPILFKKETTTMKVKITLLEEVLGSSPSNEELLATYIAKIGRASCRERV